MQTVAYFQSILLGALFLTVALQFHELQKKEPCAILCLFSPIEKLAGTARSLIRPILFTIADRTLDAVSVA